MEQKFWNKPSCLSMTEVEKILKSEEGLSVCNRAVISLLCEISLRNSEICSLKVEDISFQNKNIMVCCKKTTPKTLTLSEGCLLLLKEYIEQHPTKRGTLFVSNKESNFQ